MYWVHWNTRNAKLARKSLAESRPATGRSWNPVRTVCVEERWQQLPYYLIMYYYISWRCGVSIPSLPLRKDDTSSS